MKKTRMLAVLALLAVVAGVVMVLLGWAQREQQIVRLRADLVVAIASEAESRFLAVPAVLDRQLYERLAEVQSSLGALLEGARDGADPRVAVMERDILPAISVMAAQRDRFLALSDRIDELGQQEPRENMPDVARIARGVRGDTVVRGGLERLTGLLRESQTTPEMLGPAVGKDEARAFREAADDFSASRLRAVAAIRELPRSRVRDAGVAVLMFLAGTPLVLGGMVVLAWFGFRARTAEVTVPAAIGSEDASPASLPRSSESGGVGFTADAAPEPKERQAVDLAVYELRAALGETRSSVRALVDGMTVLLDERSPGGEEEVVVAGSLVDALVSDAESIEEARESVINAALGLTALGAEDARVDLFEQLDERLRQLSRGMKALTLARERSRQSNTSQVRREDLVRLQDEVNHLFDRLMAVKGDWPDSK